ncbi:MAG: hypothetical protein SA339_09690 [Methanomassiliicoccus sp.]|nr:hypothetical protein [Methanomassiliicoccus sp.]
MMEFVMSRVWMVIAGLAVLTVIMAAFAGLDRKAEEAVDMEGASTLSSVISDLQRNEATAEMAVDMGAMISDQQVTFSISTGTIEINEGRRRGIAGFYEAVTLIIDGQAVDRLEVGRDDVLLIRSSAGKVQLEKVSTM